jgi:class 3 adenylate cyclase/predicted ATPase
VTPEDRSTLSVYLPNLAASWPELTPAARSRTLQGTLAFVDISGFTRLTELLSAGGKAGAEELTGHLDAIFGDLVDIAYAHGGELIKWGGDAVLLWYDGEQHAERAVTAAWLMQRSMRRIGRLTTSAGRVALQMSVGIHSGDVHFFSVGSLHRELVVTGPAATRTAHLEGIAEAGEIVISHETAARLPPSSIGAAKHDAVLVAAPPRLHGPTPRTPTEPAGRPEDCLPAALRDFLRAAPPEGEHRQVGVGFVEFSGVDDLLAVSPPASVAGTLGDFFTLVQECCAKNQVTFWETDIAEGGGKVMLVAGAPTASEDDAGSLLVTARELVGWNGGLRVRAGVNFGRVFTGGFGPPYRRTYSAKGDAVNLAARLMSRAEPGTVLAAETALERSRTPFHTEALAPFTVKGKTLPVRARRVLHVEPGRKPATHQPPVLVGRDEELRILLGLLSDARRGVGRCVEITGPAGIGKSRLIAELEARSNGFRMVGTVSGERDALQAYSSIRRLARRAIGIEPGEDPEACGRSLVASVARTAPRLTPWIPLVAPIVGANAQPTPESSLLDERFRPQRTTDTFLDLLSAHLPGPTLLVVEEAQWIDEASASLLRDLAAGIGGRPWLLVVAYRAADRAALLAEPQTAQRIELAPLSPAATGQLVRSLSVEHPLVPYQRDAVAARSGGNPLFVLELLRAEPRSGGLQEMPDTVEGVFASQIDRLSPPERSLLRTASVLGVEVPLQVLGELAGGEVDLTAPLLEGYLLPDTPGRLRFRHSLLRDVAYEGLAYARRRALHLRAGEVLERLGGGAAETAGLLAEHFAAAGDHRRAWHYASLAGWRARSVPAPLEAAANFEHALREGRAAQGIPPRELMQVAEALADARCHLGEFAAAGDRYRDARRFAARNLDRSRLLYKAALAAERSGRYRTTLQLLTRAERHLGPGHSGWLLRQRAEIRAQYGLVRHRQGRADDAVRALREAVGLAGRAQAADVLATSLVYLDIAELTAGIPEDRGHAERALRIQGRLRNDPWLEARALNQLGIRAYFAGRWSDAAGFYEASRAACERAGDAWTAALESANLAEILADQGHLEEARPILEEVLETCRAAGTRTFVADGTRLLGRLASRRGDPERAGQLLDAAREIYEADGEALQVQLTDAVGAEARLVSGDPAGSVELARRVIDAVSSLPGRHLVLPLALRTLGVGSALLGGRPADARRAVEESAAIASRHGARFELALSLQVIGDLWPGELGEERRARCDALFAELGVLDTARRLVPADPLARAGHQNIGSPA